jgi:hypothetical protein
MREEDDKKEAGNNNEGKDTRGQEPTPRKQVSQHKKRNETKRKERTKEQRRRGDPNGMDLVLSSLSFSLSLCFLFSGY